MATTSIPSQLRLAIYGKGGIGKSTLAANLSASFAYLGRRVLLIGCDPKHDSTRLLLKGRKVPTVLEHLNQPSSQASWLTLRRSAMSPERTVRQAMHAGVGLPFGMSRETVLHQGSFGVHCIETGGPIPGVGCAGRGILSTFELVEQLKIDLACYDVVIYDVLGDVVCGGFGVPLRAAHANRILLVSSEEFMPIYAANNILRGVNGYGVQTPRVVGMFLNRRSNESSSAQVERFAAATGLPVIARWPRSQWIGEAERRAQTLQEAFPSSEEATTVLNAARQLLSGHLGPGLCSPLEPLELERVVLNRQPGLAADIARSRPCPATPAQRRSSPLRIALYGKGGIGKSTIAANLSATLAARGLHVLQVGCDPKHDSTRLLTGGQAIPTVLERLASPMSAPKPAIHQGVYGVHCVEIGGPEPGVGCAGRGILSAFSAMTRLGIEMAQYDVVLYDVLGDVVCGGFAIPLQSQYADVVLLVTSEEFMSLYAANNILAGIRNLEGADARLLGLIYNARNNSADSGSVERFALAVGLPILTRLPRSEALQAAEQRGLPMLLADASCVEMRQFEELADVVLTAEPRLVAQPLSETDLDRVVLEGLPRLEAPSVIESLVKDGSASGADGETFTKGIGVQFTDAVAPIADPYFYRKKPLRPPVWECAFHATVLSALKIRDAVVVAHSPASCAHMRRLEAAGSCAQQLKKRRGFYPDPMVSNLVCTDLREQELIYGGTESLIRTLTRVLERQPPVVFLVTACVPAIIGDNIADAIERVRAISPKTQIVPLRSDGNLTGGGLNGYLSALVDGYIGLAHQTDQTSLRSVNLVLDWNYDDSRVATELLTDIGIGINCRFTDGTRDTTAAELSRLGRASLTLICTRSFLAELVAKLVNEALPGTVVARERFPRGFYETAIWLREIARFFDVEPAAERRIAHERALHDAAMAPARVKLQGKRIIVLTHGHPIDDVLDTARDLRMEIAMVGVMGRQQDTLFRTRHQEIPVRFCVHPEERMTLVREVGADAVFGPVRHDLPPDLVVLDTVGAHESGFKSGARLAARWARLFESPRIEGWRQDLILGSQASTSASGSRFLRRTTP